MSKIRFLFNKDIIGQFKAPNITAIEEPKEVLTFNRSKYIYWFFFKTVYKNLHHSCVRRTNYRNLTEARTRSHTA